MELREPVYEFAKLATSAGTTEHMDIVRVSSPTAKDIDTEYSKFINRTDQLVFYTLGNL